MVQAVYLVFGVIEALLVLRFALRARPANPAAPFARFIYGITGPLVAPFAGLFATPAVGASAFELFTLIALAVYLLLAWLLARLLWLIFGEARSAVHSSSTSVRAGRD